MNYYKELAIELAEELAGVYATEFGGCEWYDNRIEELNTLVKELEGEEE